MNYHMKLMRITISLLLALTMANNISSQDDMSRPPYHSQTDCLCSGTEDCYNEIKFRKLCVRHLLANHISGKKIETCDLCAKMIKSNIGCFNTININDMLCVNRVDTTTANVDKLNVNDLCVSGALRAHASSICNNIRATAVFSTNTTYTLGSVVNWDNISDDPNNDMSFIPNTHYTAPLSGYYLVTYQVDAINLVSTSGTILGTPISALQIRALSNLAMNINLG
jgi:hypothetical protein